MRLFLSLVAYLATLAIVAVVSFFAVILLAGPHAGLLPGWLESAVMVLGLLAVLVVPCLAARKVWRHWNNQAPP